MGEESFDFLQPGSGLPESLTRGKGGKSKTKGPDELYQFAARPIRPAGVAGAPGPTERWARYSGCQETPSQPLYISRLQEPPDRLASRVLQIITLYHVCGTVLGARAF